MSNETDRYVYLDGLRGYAALAVVFSHTILAVDYALLGGQQPDSRSAWDIWLSGTPFFPPSSLGSPAVCVFFVLSGYVLANSFARSRQTWPAMVVRRFVRLALPMLAGCLLAWALLSAGLMRNIPASQVTHSSWLGAHFHQAPNLIKAIIEPVRTLFGTNIGVAETYDSSLWTMPIESLGSLLLITLFVAFRRSGGKANLFTGLTCAALTVLLSEYFVALVCLGAAVNLLAPRRLPALRGWATAALMIAGLLFGTVPYSPARWSCYNIILRWVTHFIHGNGLWTMRPEDFLHAVGAILVVAAVLLSPALQRVLSRAPARFLGRISFPLYILHVPLLMVIEAEMILRFGQTNLPPLLSSIISVLAMAAIAVTIAALVTPAIEGSAITLSRLIGQKIDEWTRAIPLFQRTGAILGFRRNSGIARAGLAGGGAQNKNDTRIPEETGYITKRDMA